MPLALSRIVRRPAGFAWQALLVVPPLVILAVMALLSLRQDRAAIDEEARQNATRLATDLGRELGLRVGATLEHWLAREDSAVAARSSGASADTITTTAPAWVGVIVRGLVREPLDHSTLPLPPPWVDRLSAAHRRALGTVESILSRDRANPSLDRALAALVASNPPPALATYAEWLRLRREVLRAGTSASAVPLVEFARRHPDDLSPSGTSLADLSLLLALRRLATGDLPREAAVELSNRVRGHPSFLTPELLSEARRVAGSGPSSRVVAAVADRYEAASRTWGVIEQRRRTASGTTPPPIEWVEDDGQWCLVVEQPLTPALVGVTGLAADWRYVVVVPEEAVERSVGEGLQELSSRLPAYAAASVSIAGRSVRPSSELPVIGRATATLPVPAVLNGPLTERLGYEFTGLASPLGVAAAGARRPVRLRTETNPLPFSVAVHLRDREALYSRYRQRQFWSAGLVMAAAGAALLALASTWRAFRKQTHLAEMQSNFVASVSHEFRAPVASVRLMAENLERGSVPDEAKRREYLGLMVQECRRLTSLVENVLDFSRIDQGRRQYRFEPADLRDVARHAVVVMAPVAQQHSVTLESVSVEDTDSPLRTLCDPQAIHQALVNLIDNAVKHSPPGSEVQVGCEAADDGALIRLWVQDRGVGIPADALTRIFEPFYRRGSELRRETSGIGIGLAIVRHVAEAHDGKVHVESTIGRGSRFTVEIPVVIGPAGSATNPVSEGEAR